MKLVKIMKWVWLTYLEGLRSLDDEKPTNPWVYLSKLKQGQLNEQDYTLIFEKLWSLLPLLA